MARLDHIRWLGGSTGAGKTTIAHFLAHRSGVAVYSTDATISAHSLKLSAAAAPLLDRFRRMGMDERWVQRDPMEMYRTFPWFAGEGFDLLVEDLHALPTDRITLVEGFRLLPDLTRRLLSKIETAVWLISTPTFRRAAFARRDQSEAFWLRTADPQRALDHLLLRDELFASELAAACARNGLATIAIDRERDLETTAAAIADRFGL